MITERNDRSARLGARRAVWACALVVLACTGCTGGVPSIPEAPNEILKKADAYFQRGKYWPSSELYKAFLSRYPGDDRSDYAQFMLAESYYNDEEYALAGVEYRIVVADYGYSEYVDDAFLKTALCLYHRAPKPQLDQTYSYDALGKLREFIRAFPDSPLVPEAQSYIREINAKLAEKDFLNAMFYFDRNRFVAAGIYLDKIIDNYPDNMYWANACYFRARVYMRTSQDDKAKTLLLQVLAYPDELSVKRSARSALKELEQ